jgi:3-oxoadipate CoA-transferase, alpha subunit
LPCIAARYSPRKQTISGVTGPLALARGGQIVNSHSRKNQELALINKTFESIASAVEGITDGSTIMVGGFGTAGMPSELIDALIDIGTRDLTIISNNAGNGDIGLAALLKAGSVRKVICSFPRQSDSYVFDELYRAGKIELEVVPQGNLAEREINGRQYVLEMPLHADFALIKAYKGDRWGNLVYRKAARNFGPIMAMAARTAIAQVDQIVELGELDPEHIITPGIFVQRVVAVSGASASSIANAV